MKTDPHIADPDAFYDAWIKAQEHMNESGSADYNARLVLLLANQVGDSDTLLACIEAAKQS